MNARPTNAAVVITRRELVLYVEANARLAEDVRAAMLREQQRQTNPTESRAGSEAMGAAEATGGSRETGSAPPRPGTNYAKDPEPCVNRWPAPDGSVDEAPAGPLPMTDKSPSPEQDRGCARGAIDSGKAGHRPPGVADEAEAALTALRIAAFVGVAVLVAAVAQLLTST